LHCTNCYCMMQISLDSSQAGKLRRWPGRVMERKTKALSGGGDMQDQTPKPRRSDPLMVQSVAKAFRVLTAFDKGHGSLTLSQIAQLTEMDVSTAQRFTHTLTQLGYLKKDPATRQFELSTKTLDLAYHY